MTRGDDREYMSRGLTVKQRRFVAEYCIDFNATQAAIRAKYSAKTASRIGPELLGKTCVAEAIQRKVQRLNARTEITAERTLREYARIAYADMRSFMTWGPDGVRLINSLDLDDDDAVCVAEVSETTTKDGGSIRLKLHDKKGALDFLAKRLELAKDEMADAVRETGQGLTALLRQYDARHTRDD